MSIFVVLTFILMELTEDKLEYIAFVGIPDKRQRRPSLRPLRLPPHPYPRLRQQHGNSARRLRPSLRSKNRNRPSRRSRRQSNGRLPRRNLNPASRPDGPCRSRRNNVPYNNRRRRIRAIRFGRRRRRRKFPTALRNSPINRRCRTQATGLR